MTTPEPRREWLALLEAELTRRGARTEWEAGEGERQQQWVLDTLASMALRFAATAETSLHPLEIADMSIAERLACTLLPEPLRPAGLPPEEEIWGEFEARRDGKRG